MLVCNVSQLARRAAIAADIEETAVATDALGTGNVVFATLVDDPASVGETVDAFLGEIMLEATSASDAVDVGLAYDAAATEAATGTDSLDATITAAIVTTWNPSDKASNVVLTNGNLTAGINTVANGGVRSTTSFSSGKHYFEANWSASPGNQNSIVGISLGTSSLIVGPTSGQVVVFGTNGNIIVSGAASGSTIGAPGTGKICIAIDFGADLFWARLNGGNWNGSGTADPATGAGGISVSAAFGGAIAGFALASVNGTDMGKTVTVNFGASAFAQTVPSGFSAWG
jgi:hypothetical protein